MEAITAILSIVLINLVLSGDNAVVIGMAAHRLPPKQRQVAIIFGGAAAIVLRIILTAIAAILLGIPAIKAIGGALLLWIAFKLLKEEEETSEGLKVASTMRGAVMTILVADLIMSLDNVLGVAAASHGDIGLLIFGLVGSMLIVMLGGGIIAALINRLWWLAYVGSGVIAYTGAELILEDTFVEESHLIPAGADVAISIAVMLVTLAIAHYVHRHRPAQRRAQEQVAPAQTSSV